MEDKERHWKTNKQTNNFEDGAIQQELQNIKRIKLWVKLETAWQGIGAIEFKIF